MMRCLMLALLLACTHAANNKDLLKAIKENNPSLVNIALKSGDKVNAVDEATGDSPMLTAVRAGKHKALKALIKAKADLTAVGKDGLPAMHLAASLGFDRVMQVLLPAGVAPSGIHEADGLAPLHRAVMGGFTDATKTLLNAEVPGDLPTADGRLPVDLTPSSKEGLAIKEILKKFSRPSSSSAKSEL